LASYARSWERFEDAGLQVAAICVDSVEQNRAMVDKLLLPFPVLSDPDATVIEPWGVLNVAEKGIAKPALFLVRPDWSFAYRYVGVDFTDRPTDEELFAAARAAQRPAGHPGGRS
jgi:peroxiredoxin